MKTVLLNGLLVPSGEYELRVASFFYTPSLLFLGLQWCSPGFRTILSGSRLNLSASCSFLSGNTSFSTASYVFLSASYRNTHTGICTIAVIILFLCFWPYILCAKPLNLVSLQSKSVRLAPNSVHLSQFFVRLALIYPRTIFPTKKPAPHHLELVTPFISFICIFVFCVPSS